MDKKYNITIGVFDGVHLGHKYIIEELLRISDVNGATPLIVTFSNHPRNFLFPEDKLLLLNTLSEKLELINKLNIDNVEILEFNYNLSKLSAFKFIELISKKYRIDTLLLGYDHTFGSDFNDDSYAKYSLIEKTFDIKIVKSQSFIIDDINISSSKIRKLLLIGDISLTNRYLDYNYFISGVVVDGFKRGRELGFPTANINIDSSKLLPKIGVYSAYCYVADIKYKAMINIGVRPTYGTLPLSIEAHLLDFNGDLYGQEVRVEFINLIREERYFDSLQKLINQLKKDKITANLQLI